MRALVTLKGSNLLSRETPASPERRRIPAMIPQNLLELLACPVCKKPLVLKVNPEALKCNACQRVYPVRDDIPILMVDQASFDPS